MSTWDLSKLSTKQIGRMAIGYHECGETASPDDRVHAWKSYNDLTQTAIGQEVIRLNDAGIDWKSFEDLDEMRDAAQDL